MDDIIILPPNFVQLSLQDGLILLQAIKDFFEALLLLLMLLCLLLQPLGELGDLSLELFGLVALLKEDGIAGFDLLLALDGLQGKRIRSAKQYKDRNETVKRNRRTETVPESRTSC